MIPVNLVTLGVFEKQLHTYNSITAYSLTFYIFYIVTFTHPVIIFTCSTTKIKKIIKNVIK